eukprot:Gb_14544 [translate_table: standard]
MDSVISWTLSKPLAVYACTGMASTYVGLLYAPRLLLRLPPPVSLKEHLLRRFACAAVASIIAVFASLLLLPVWDFQKTPIVSLFAVYGVRMDHLWQAVLFPLFLTALLYLGPLVIAVLDFIIEWDQEQLLCGCGTVKVVKSAYRKLACYTWSIGSDILAWRNYVVAPLTEELVFRACMIPLLLCGGIKPYAVIFLCPVFFSLAHLNHFWELYYQQSYDISRAALIVGLQLGYTVVFGWYAAFLFIRTGHLIAPIVAHTFCNAMGLPNRECIRRGKVTTTLFLAGIAAFFLMLVPATYPALYNDSTDSCSCWHGFCNWKSNK